MNTKLRVALENFTNHINGKSKYVRICLREFRPYPDGHYSVKFDVRMQFESTDPFVDVEAYNRGEAYLHLNSNFRKAIETTVYAVFSANPNWNNTGSVFFWSGHLSEGGI